VRSYRTLSPLPPAETGGGLLSVALSLGSPPAGVTRRHFAVEPGLSSPSLAGGSDRPAVWSAAKVGARPTCVKPAERTALQPRTIWCTNPDDVGANSWLDTPSRVMVSPVESSINVPPVMSCHFTPTPWRV
jgi:hypothetical protein